MDETASQTQLAARLPLKYHWSDPSYSISVERPVKGQSNQELSISFQRTVRVADNNKVNDLPPSLGEFPIYDTSDYEKTLSKHMSAKGGFFIPMYRKSSSMIFMNQRYTNVLQSARLCGSPSAPNSGLQSRSTSVV